MKATWIKLQFVAGNYTRTMGNIWGPTSRVVGRGTLDEAKSQALATAKANGITDVFLKVGRSDWQAL